MGYARAGRIIDQMEERGIISGYQGSKPREVLMSKEKWQELKMGTTPSASTTSGQIQVAQVSDVLQPQEQESTITKTYEAIKKVSAMNNSEEEY